MTNVTFQAPLEVRSVSLNQVVKKLPFDRELNVPLLVPQEGYANPNHTSQSIYGAPSEAGTLSPNHLEKLPYNSELKDPLLASRVGHFNPSRTQHSSSPFQTNFDAYCASNAAKSCSNQRCLHKCCWTTSIRLFVEFWYDCKRWCGLYRSLRGVPTRSRSRRVVLYDWNRWGNDGTHVFGHNL